MKTQESLRLGKIAIAVLVLSLLAAGALQEERTFTPVKPKPEKLCPINFILDPVTSLQSRIAADTEKTNAKLATKLGEFREELRKYAPRSAELKTRLVGLAEEYMALFAGTYLAKPRLWDEFGRPYTGWTAILQFLSNVVPSTTFIHPQGVNVYLDYVAPQSETFDRFASKQSYPLSVASKEALIKMLEQEIDFYVSIRTVLAYAPYDDPLIIGNETAAPHRKLCETTY